MRTIRTTQLTSMPLRGHEKNTLFFTDFYSPCYLLNNILIRFFSSRSYSLFFTVPRSQAGVCDPLFRLLRTVSIPPSQW